MDEDQKVREVLARLDRVHHEIEKLADEMGLTYDQLMEAADRFLATGEITEDLNPSNSAAWWNGDESKFWDLYEQVRGFRDSANGWFFECNC